MSMLFKRIKDWAVRIASFRTGDVIAVDGPNGTAKMSKDDLLKETSQNALVGNLAPEFDPTRTENDPYIAYKNTCVYEGELYECIFNHYGPWVASHFIRTSADTAVHNLNYLFKGGFVPVKTYRKDGSYAESDIIDGFITSLAKNFVKADGADQIKIVYRNSSDVWLGELIVSKDSYGVFEFTPDKTQTAKVRFYSVSGHGDFTSINIVKPCDGFAEGFDGNTSKITLKLEKSVSKTSAQLNGGYVYMSRYGNTNIGEGDSIAIIPMSDGFVKLNEKNYIKAEGPTSIRLVYRNSSGGYISEETVLKNDDGYFEFYPENPTISIIRVYANHPKFPYIDLYEYYNSMVEKINSIPPNPETYLRVVPKIHSLYAASRVNKVSEGSKDFQLCVITDSHGDNIAVNNGVKFSSILDTVDCVVHCGDAKRAYWVFGDNSDPDPSKEIVDPIIASSKPYYFVIGNHEAGNNNSVKMTPSSKLMYEKIVLKMVEKGFLNEGEYTENCCYYYHDFSERNIRLIVLNEYDSPLDFDETYWKAIDYDPSYANEQNSHTYNVGDRMNIQGWTEKSFECVQQCTTPSTQWTYDTEKLPRYKFMPGARCIRQQQAQWFLNTLASTPANYGVVVALHQVPSRNMTAINKKFTQPSEIGREVNNYADYMQTDFIANAVHAFMLGTNYSEDIVMSSFASYLNGAEGYYYHVEKNFATKNSGVKFLCFFGGHMHKDIVWKHNEKNIYSVISTCSSTQYAQSKNSDIRRTTADGFGKDSMLTISFNHDDRKISLVKLGVDVTETMEKRDFEQIDLN